MTQMQLKKMKVIKMKKKKRMLIKMQKLMVSLD